MTDKSLFYYSINEYNLYSDSPFDLNVDFLSNVIPEITNQLSPSRKISIYNNVTKIIHNVNIYNGKIYI